MNFTAEELLYMTKTLLRQLSMAENTIVQLQAELDRANKELEAAKPKNVEPVQESKEAEVVG